MRKLYTVLTQKEIPSLNGIKGPLTTPVEIDSIVLLNFTHWLKTLSTASC